MFIQKNKTVFIKKVPFQKRISLSDHLNVFTRNTDIYFVYIVAKTRRKNDHYVAILRFHACLPISENITETVVFVLRKTVRCLLKLYLKILDKIYD